MHGCVCFLSTSNAEQKMHTVYMVYSGQKYQTKMLGLFIQDQLNYSVYNRCIRTLRMILYSLLLYKIFQTNKIYWLPLLVWITSQRDEMVVSQEQFVFRILGASNFTKISSIKKAFLKLCYVALPMLHLKHGAECLNSLHYSAWS